MRIRRPVSIIVVLAVLAPLLAALAGLAGPVPRHDGPPSDHFDGETFYNTPPFRKRFADFLQWQLDRDRGDWERDLAAPGLPPPPARLPPGRLRVTWINHATVLVQAGPLNILTDPVWSRRAGPLAWLGPERHLAPGVDFEALPPIDAVLVSHNHFDHMDLDTLARLAARDGPLFLVPLANCAYLEAFARGRCRELDWWQSAGLGEGVAVTAVPARHWSRRGLFDTNRALWAGWVVEGPRRVYFAGDTGAGGHFAEARDRLGPPDLAFLPIGAYLPRWFMADQHLAPAEAVEAARALGAAEAMAVHHATFELADDGQWEAARALRDALAGRPGLAERFWVPGHGEAREWGGPESVAGR